MMEQVQKEVNRIIFLVLKVGIVPATGLVLARNWDGLVGFILGLSVAILSFKIMARNAWKITGCENPVQGQALALTGYFIRFFFYALTLAAALNRSGVTFLACALGLVFIKFTLLGEGILKQFMQSLHRKLGPVKE